MPKLLTHTHTHQIPALGPYAMKKRIDSDSPADS